MNVTEKIKYAGNEIVGSPSDVARCTVTFHGRQGRLIIGPNVSLKTVNIHIYDDAEIMIDGGTVYTGTLRAMHGCSITLGEKIKCNSYLNISAAEETKVVIGKYSLVSMATIRSSDMHAIHDIRSRERINFGKDVLIGEKVWLGQDCMILKGVSVGSGSVVAAKAVVTKDVPASSIVAGNPGRIIREGVTWGGDFPFRPSQAE